MPPHRDPLLGTTLAGYRLLEPIGEGGTSAVYKAEHAAHGRVALKVLREKLRQDRTAIARFVREATFGQRVTHPNVVRTIEIGEADGAKHYLAIEWAEGELLERYAKRHGALPREDAAHIVRQIADAVQAAHDAGIIHRDLKPDNVMYDPQSRRVKLLDFGIATSTDATQDDRLTRAGFFVGTLMYVAPEALSGELVGAAADQYSLATIAYLLLTGCLPYAAKSPREMFTLLLSQPPTPLNKAKPGLAFPATIESTIMKGLSKNPKDRYGSVSLFAEALEQAIGAPEEQKSGGLFGKVKGLFGKK